MIEEEKEAGRGVWGTKWTSRKVLRREDVTTSGMERRVKWGGNWSWMNRLDFMADQLPSSCGCDSLCARPAWRFVTRTTSYKHLILPTLLDVMNALEANESSAFVLCSYISQKYESNKNATILTFLLTFRLGTRNVFKSFSQNACNNNCTKFWANLLMLRNNYD